MRSHPSDQATSVTMDTHDPLDTASRYALVIIALLQGGVLCYLHFSLGFGAEGRQLWPATDLRWLAAIYTLVIALPGFFYMGLERFRDSRNLLAAAVLAPLLFWLGWHLGWLAQAADLALRGGNFIMPFVASIGTSLFILAVYFRAWSHGGRLKVSYPQLVAYSWQNALILALLGLFIGVFWLLLMLWSELFRIIGVDVFATVFNEPIFVYPVTWLVGGIGLVMIRSRIRLIAMVQFMCEVLIKALLPLACLIGVLFLAALPFTGLQKIWDTGHAALLMMLLAIVLLFFFNAVFSEQAESPPYPRVLRCFVYLGILLLPINSLLAAWALWLRIDQYGFTVDRLWAGVIQLLIAAFTLTYAVMLPWKRGDALRGIHTINSWLGIGMAVVLIAINTPLADLRDWSAESQSARLSSGKVDPDEYEYAYLRFELGAYGVRVLERLSADKAFAEEHPLAAKGIDAALARESRYDRTPQVDTSDPDAVAAMFRIDASASPPDSLMRVVAEQQNYCLSSSGLCAVVQATSPDADYWIVFYTHYSPYSSGEVYRQTPAGGRKIGSASLLGCQHEEASHSGNLGKLERLPGPFMVFTDGECYYQIEPELDYLIDRPISEDGNAGG